MEERENQEDEQPMGSMSKTQQEERAESWPGADQIAPKAYSHEVIRCGFWSGNEQFNEAAFYAYSAPSPPELEAASLRPSSTFYSPELAEFFLLNEDVRQARSPEQVLLDFFHSTYEAGATCALGS